MKNLIKLFTLIVIILLFISSITSCNKKVEETKKEVVLPTFNSASAKAEIVAVNKDFMNHFSAIDSPGLASLYTNDAKFMINGAPAISGKENIQSTFSAIMNSGVSRAKLTTIDVWGTEDFITEKGSVSLYVGDDEVDQGKYSVL